MRTLAIDIETYSSVDLKTAGVYRYREAPDFEVLLFGYSLDGAPPRVIDLTEGPLPEEVIGWLYDGAILKTAYNAAFEMACLNQHLYENGYPPMDPAQWEDTMLLAAYNGYGGSLDEVGRALGLEAGARKDAAGTALIAKFSKPRKPTARDPRTRIRPADDPAAWRGFIEYNRRDVTAEQAIREALRHPLPESEKAAWLLDHRIQEAGIGVDMDLVDAALELDASEKARITAELTGITGIPNPKSGPKMKEWLGGRMGRKIESLTKETVPALADECRAAGLDDAVRALDLRQELEKTSLAKYRKIREMACDDGRVRGMLQFYGSRTGRWAGRGVQVQNLPRNSLKDPARARDALKHGDLDALREAYGPNLSDTASQLLRTAFVAAPGMAFAVADYSAIEARVIAWLSGEDWRLDVFRSGGDIYVASAAQMFGVPEGLILDKSRPEHALRARGKVAELALGYGGGVGAIARMDYQGAIPESDRPGIVKSWRRKSPRITGLWRECERAALGALDGRPQTAAGGRIAFSVTGGADSLDVRLPSGRVLSYPQPRRAAGRWGGPALTFLGLNQASRKFGRIETYGGKLVENITQAVARDCLSEALMRLDAAGFAVRFHVHDEVIAETPARGADEELRRMVGVMCQTPEWAEGLPLNAEGFVSEFYKKE